MVTTACEVVQAACHQLENLVAQRLAMAFVKLLEVIKVDQAHRQHILPVPGARNLLREARCQCGAVWQAGQDVMIALPRHLLAQLLLLAHVAKHQHRAADLAAAGAQRGRRIFDRQHLAVASAQALAAQLDDGAAGQDGGHGLEQQVLAEVVGQRDNLMQVLPPRAGRQVASELLGDRVQAVDLAAQVGGDDGVADRGERHLDALLFHLQRTLGLARMRELLSQLLLAAL